MLRLDLQQFSIDIIEYEGEDENIRQAIKGCQKQGTHLTDVDSDGYCNYCGYQEGGAYITFGPRN